MTSALATALFTRLKAVTAVTDLIGTGDNCRAYAGQAPHGVTAPYLVFFEIAGTAHTSHGTTGDAEDTLDETLVQFTHFGQTLAAAVGLREAVREALLSPGAMAGIVATNPQTRGGFEEEAELHRADLDLTFFHNPTAA